MALTGRKSHRYLGGATAVESLQSGSLDYRLELEESDIWAVDDAVLPEDPGKVYTRPARKPIQKPSVVGDHLRTGLGSLPVTIPERSNILGGEYRPGAAGSYDDDECRNGESEINYRMPPHKFLARNRVAPFSVSMKGRELRRVRNAIWKKTGFED